MHYITVATSSTTFKQDCNRRQVQYNLCVQNIGLTFRELIQQTFRCTECARHFVRAYDMCLFNRPGCSSFENVSLEGEASTKLQLWLFHLHNNVTMRVYRSHYDNEQRRDKAMRTGYSPRNEAELKWPFGSDTPIEDHNIIEKLRQAYLSPTWASVAPRVSLF